MTNVQGADARISVIGYVRSSGIIPSEPFDTEKLKKTAISYNTLKGSKKNAAKDTDMLPETADVYTDEDTLMIRDHKPNIPLLKWMLDIVAYYDHDEVFAEMEWKGIMWPAVSKHIMAELADIAKPDPEDPDPMDEKMMVFANSKLGIEFREGMIDSIKKSKSYQDFAKQFNDDNAFVADFSEKLEKILDA